MKRITMLLISVLLLTSVSACSKKQDDVDAPVDSVIAEREDEPAKDTTPAPEADDDNTQTPSELEDEPIINEDDKEDGEQEDELPPPSNYGEDDTKPFKTIDNKDFKCSFDPNVNEVYIFDYIGRSGKVVLPDEINGYPVTVIFDGAFRNSIVTEISGGANIKKIQYEAFRGNTRLKKVTLPKNLEELETRAFESCPELEEVWVPKTIKDWSMAAFANCPKLTKITFEDGLTHVGYAAFQFAGIESVTLPASIKELGMIPFANCDNLKSVYFEGDAPSVEDDCQYVFRPSLNSNNDVTLYHKEGAKGWDTTPLKNYYKIEVY